MEDLAEGLIDARSPDDAVDAFLKGTGHLGVVNVSLRVLVSGDYAFSFSTSPVSWREHYFAEGYNQIDPSVVDLKCQRKSTLRCFDPTHPSFSATGRVADLFDGTRQSAGNAVYCSYFGSQAKTSVVSMFTDAAGLQIDTWAQSNTARLSLMAAAFNHRVHELVDDTYLPFRPDAVLTARERDCVMCLANGLRVSAIAYKLDISERTVEFHIANARNKLNAPTRENLVAQVLLS